MDLLTIFLLAALAMLAVALVFLVARRGSSEAEQLRMADFP